jgi:hypothetical protein
MVKLSALESSLLVSAVVSQTGQLNVTALTPTERAACKRLIKKGLMDNIMGTFFKVNDAGRERTKSIY